MMCHGSVVWWPRLGVERAKRELGEIQRLVCICVTGAMRTTATAALETLLDLPPMDLMVQARATADRLEQCGQCTPNFQAGHGRIFRVISDPIFDMPRDKTLPVIDFARNFDVEFPSREDWLNGWPITSPENCKVRFTDGSKTSDATGAGIYDPETDEGTYFHLGKISSVPQAEAFAILMGIQEVLPIGVHEERVVICSDSKGMIEALASPITNSKLIKECKDYLNMAGLRNRISLVWVPGHSNVDGNENADVLAKAGSSAQGNGPVCICCCFRTCHY